MAEQREKILAAAKKLIGHFGVRKTSIEDIAEEAGMSKANLYYYFSGKEDICMEVINIESRKLQEQIRKKSLEADSVEARIIMYIHHRLQYFYELKNKYKFLFKEFYSHKKGISRVRMNFYEFEGETIDNIIQGSLSNREVFISLLKTLIIGYELRILMGEPFDELSQSMPAEIKLISINLVEEHKPGGIKC